MEYCVKMKKILVLCHDQRLDRRIIAQVSTLVELGHEVTLLALSLTNECGEECLPEGVRVVRIGLGKIVPENAIYRFYIRSQNRLNSSINLCRIRLPKLNSFWSFCDHLGARLNWKMYKFLLVVRYWDQSMGDPLCFRKAFFEAGLPYKSDLIQVHDLPALEAGVDLSKEWRVPLVYDAHELYPEQHAFSYVQKKLCSHREKKWTKKCSLIFAVNDSIADEMAVRYNITRPVTLTNAIDPPSGFDMNASYNLLRRKLELSESRKILLFQGGFSPNRNLEKLVDAMRYVRNPDVDLVMMGFGDYEKCLKDQAEKLELLNKRIYFLPAVSQEELLYHTASADVGIIPYPHVDLNSYYCTPNKLFEFIQAGLPILANNSPELKKFVQDTGFGLISNMRTSKEIAKGIDEILVSHLFPLFKKSMEKNAGVYAWREQKKIYLNHMDRLLTLIFSEIEKNG